MSEINLLFVLMVLYISCACIAVYQGLVIISIIFIMFSLHTTIAFYNVLKEDQEIKNPVLGRELDLE